MMRRVTSTAFVSAAIILTIVALLVGAPSLFYMSTAVIATMVAGKFQAYLSVQWLKVERVAPAVAHVGELVSVETVVWSLRRIRRPLITIDDDLPEKMVVADRTPSLPIAPGYDAPVRSQYRFRPLRRGDFKWSGAVVSGSDALGLSRVTKRYGTAPTELLVVPAPVPITIDAPAAGGLGISEAGTGQARGGLEPRGIREYAPGDSLRHIHWRSTARTGTLLVKEFEAGSQAVFGLLLQRTSGSDYGPGPVSSLDLMCGHALFISQELNRGGADAVFPQFEDPVERDSGSGRTSDIEALLARVEANRPHMISRDLLVARDTPQGGSVFYVFIARADAALPLAIRDLMQRGNLVTVLIFDPVAFGTRPAKGESAAEPEYVDALTATGARTMIVPVSQQVWQ